MPLTPHELRRLADFLHENGMAAVEEERNRIPFGREQLYGSGQYAAASPDQVEQLLSAVSQQMAVTTRLCEMAEQITDRLLIAEPPAVPTSAPAEQKPKRRRGRPSKAEQEAKAAAAEDKSANGEDKREVNATPAGNNDDNPFNEPSQGNGAEPDFLSELGMSEGKAEPPAVSEEELKDVLKAYLNKHGAGGTSKLTALLEKFGVKRFNELPPEKYGEVAALAKQELGA